MHRKTPKIWTKRKFPGCLCKHRMELSLLLEGKSSIKNESELNQQ